MRKQESTPTLYVVGDSTLASFNDPYFYPRFGYGTQLVKFFNDKIKIQNLALSGRSSKSYIQEENYQRLKETFQKGDYLLIGFGHNDQKSDDKNRFTDARTSFQDPNSFQFYLYEYYIKLAIEKGGTPILCTPIVRADLKNCYTKNSAHITPTGDYAEAILALGKEKKVTVLDLRALTKLKYEQIGFEQAKYFHAVIAGKKDEQKNFVPNFLTVDLTHLNVYGACYVAYLVATLLKNTDCPLKEYLLKEIKEPMKEDCLLPNPEYQMNEYKVPALDTYQPSSNFTTMDKEWYGTAFGDCGGIPSINENGFIAKEVKKGIYHVGQYGSTLKGKISFSSDGLAFLFKQIDIHCNFKASVKATILKTAHTKQAGFGFMLRDDCYINQKAPSELIASNSLSAGFLCKDSAMGILLKKEGTEMETPYIVDEFYQENEECKLEVIRLGQSITVTVFYQNQEYSKTYFDFDLMAMDQNYMYLGMFATRGTLVEFYDVEFEYTGTSLGA